MIVPMRVTNIQGQLLTAKPPSEAREILARSHAQLPSVAGGSKRPTHPESQCHGSIVLFVAHVLKGKTLGFWRPND